MPEQSYRLIPLTLDQWALVDIADYEWLMRWKWRAHWDDTTKSFYAVRQFKDEGGVWRHTSMHRLILGLSFGDKRKGDHKDRNTLDNRRINLRIASDHQSSCNRKKFSNNTSGFKGVVWDADRSKWRAQIRVNGKLIRLGRYVRKEDAFAAYCAAVDRYHGEFGRAS